MWSSFITFINPHPSISANLVTRQDASITAEPKNTDALTVAPQQHETSRRTVTYVHPLASTNQLPQVIWDQDWDARTEVLFHIYDKVRLSGMANFQSARISVPSGLHIHVWRIKLKDYPDDRLVDFLEYGWPVGYQMSNIPAQNVKNHSSALQYSEHVKKFIQT